MVEIIQKRNICDSFESEESATLGTGALGKVLKVVENGDVYALKKI
jgi:hypothetical protein